MNNKISLPTLPGFHALGKFRGDNSIDKILYFSYNFRGKWLLKEIWLNQHFLNFDIMQGQMFFNTRLQFNNTLASFRFK